MESHLREPASAPDPVSFDRIDDCGDYSGIDTVSKEFCPFSHRSGYDCSGCSTEYKVENKIRPVKICVIGKNSHCRKSQKTAQRVFSKQKAEADYDKYAGPDTEIHQVFHNDISCVFRSCKSGFYHCESRLHKEYKRGSDQKPDSKDFGAYGFTDC